VPPIVIDSGLGEPGSETGVGETGLECLSQLASVKKATVSGMIKTSRERRAVVAMTTSMALKSSTQFEYHGLFSNLGYMDSVSEEESLNVEHFPPSQIEIVRGSNWLYAWRRTTTTGPTLSVRVKEMFRADLRRDSVATPQKPS
jgi:hypothetical protein